MLESITALLGVLNSMSPFGVITLLGIIIFLQVKNRSVQQSQYETITGNHLHELPEIVAALKETTDALQRLESMLNKVNDNIVWVKARMNGHSG